ncbi:MAG TPA: YqiA/YcfP family alpha/beta fold hydrolase [Thermoanaerobaculia bacterium]|nr:YqiA/YcfP family alpha/beta fold hydrolase [Thermoanaerobaculia bacterium]
MNSVLYFHGFASSPASAKITLLRPILEQRGLQLVTPDLNLPSFERMDWDAITTHASDQARSLRPAVIAGSSLGALIALHVAQSGASTPLVLIAPALGISDRWREKTPPGDPIVVFNYARGAEVPIHRRFFEQMMEMTIDDQPPPVPVTVLMGRNDETIPFERVLAVWERWQRQGLANGSRFIEISAGDHSLVSEVETIAQEIVRYAVA